MIIESHGNLLTASAEALVNTVNTVGVMGKGIALQFKRAYPENFKAYAAACRDGRVQLGRMFVFETAKLTENPRFIINFPTKEHWRSRSRLSDVRAGLDDLVRVVRELKIESIAVPPLGCGHGGLNWSDVEPMIREALDPIQSLSVMLYAPEGAPAPQDMSDRTERPRLTRARACILRVLAEYSGPFGGGATLIEAQKVGYFLERFGEPLDLRFTKASYGPYSHRLQHLLQSLEGHYVSGLGDLSKPVLEADPIVVSPGASKDALAFLAQDPESGRRIDQTLALLDGFDSAYGTELLATVDWAACREGARTTSDALDVIRRWNRRKRSLFTERHVEVAMSRLRQLELIAG